MCIRDRWLTGEYPGFTLGPCSFSMKRGEILATAGESGSGKTTLARAMSRLLEEEAAVALSLIHISACAI